MQNVGVAPLLLVVDDSPFNVEPLCDLLEAMGYRVAKALSGAAALDLVRAQPPDLILLDVMMPGMNGIEVCERLRSRPETAAVPIIFITALSQTEDKVRAIEAGGDDFLSKPFDRPVLLARIRSLLRLKTARDELEASYRKLQALEALRDDLMQMIVHDLRSPLTAILGTLELAVDGDLGPLAERHRLLFHDAQNRGADALRLIEDLLELTRLEDSRLQLEHTALVPHELLQSVAERWQLRFERDGLQVRTAAAPDLAFHADPRLLQRIFDNLLANAAKHAGAGAAVQLAARLTPGGEAVRFTVADNGVGIPVAFHEQIFQQFGTARRESGAARRASGLGLTFCKLAVEAHGGRIWVESEEGQGAAFHFVLPVAPSQPRRAVPSVAPGSAPVGAA